MAGQGNKVSKDSTEMFLESTRNFSQIRTILWEEREGREFSQAECIISNEVYRLSHSERGDKMKKLKFLIIFAALFLAAPSWADTLDLSTVPQYGTINGGIFTNQVPASASGSGVLDPFVRVDNPSAAVVEGYNTSGRIDPGGVAPLDDKKDLQYTHDLLRSTVALIDGSLLTSIGGVPGTLYREFMLDINESGAEKLSPLSIVELKIWISDTPSYTGDVAGMPGTLVYDLNDANLDGVPDPVLKSILLDYKNDAGSGKADMYAYFPQRTDVAGQYIYLYSKFGDAEHPNNDGYEEWGVRKGGGSVVPLPGAVWLLGAGLVGLVGIRRRKLA